LAPTGRIFISEPNNQVQLLGSIISPAGSLFHVLPQNITNLINSLDSTCPTGFLNVSTTDPLSFQKISNSWDLSSVPEQILVPASQGIRIYIKCPELNKAITVSCSSLEYPSDKTNCRTINSVFASRFLRNDQSEDELESEREIEMEFETRGSGSGSGGSTLQNVVNDATTGASIGSTIGSLIPGVGTAIGSVAGGIIGGAIGFFSS